MSSVLQSAPIKDAVVNKQGFANKSWVFYFNLLSDGDDGTSFTPVVTSLGGIYNLAGKYFKNSGFVDFYVTIDPITSSTSTTGVTTITLPFDASVASVCFAVYNNTVLTGIISSVENKIFLPSWSAITFLTTITGRVYTK